jgi:acyl-CoA reductase-like NAD-dependent aldehyde dehydrogenase
VPVEPGPVRQDDELHQAGIEGGARLAYGGKRPADPKLARGYFVEPTVFADVTDDMRIAREEIFGPVVSILRWSDENDVVARVNALDVGSHRVDLDARSRPRPSARVEVEAGYIWINGASTHHVGVPSAATSSRAWAARSRSRSSWRARRSRTSTSRSGAMHDADNSHR